MHIMRGCPRSHLSSLWVVGTYGVCCGVGTCGVCCNVGTYGVCCGVGTYGVCCGVGTYGVCCGVGTCGFATMAGSICCLVSSALLLRGVMTALMHLPSNDLKSIPSRVSINSSWLSIEHGLPSSITIATSNVPIERLNFYATLAQMSSKSTALTNFDFPL